MAVGADSDPAGFFETLRDFEVIDRGGGFYECVPMGHSKASAIAVSYTHLDVYKRQDFCEAGSCCAVIGYR